VGRGWQWGRDSLNSLMATGYTARSTGAARSRGQGSGLALPAAPDTERWAVNKPCAAAGGEKKGKKIFHSSLFLMVVFLFLKALFAVR